MFFTFYIHHLTFQNYMEGSRATITKTPLKKNKTGFILYVKYIIYIKYTIYTGCKSILYFLDGTLISRSTEKKKEVQKQIHMYMKTRNKAELSFPIHGENHQYIVQGKQSVIHVRNKKQISILIDKQHFIPCD